MSRSWRLILVLVVATVIAVAGSHGVAAWLKIKTRAAEPFVLGSPTGKPPVFMAASSVGGYGILWGDVAAQLGTQIKTWGIAGGTPIEFEHFQKLVPEAQTTVIVVSTHDLDESLACDFRAAIIPLNQTITTLWADHADWKYAKFVLSQYPMTWLRIPFPTLGRSRGLMGATLIKVKDLVKPSSDTSRQGPVGPTIKFGKGAANDEYTRMKLSDWTPSTVVGKLVAMRVDFQGEHAFGGPKTQALERMLQYAGQRGRAIIVVLPISAAYTKAFVSPELVRKFEQTLDEVHRSAPQAEIIRLDQVPGLGSDENYCDLVHMNVFGQKLATEALLARLREPAHQS